MTMVDQQPNLFDFATSELSQDAWLCWLLAHVGLDTRPALRDAAHDFVARVWNGARPDDPIGPHDVDGPAHVERQWKHVDVLARLTVRGKLTILLVEDKTATTQHDHQLERYLATVRETWPGASIVPVYFKTGYHYESDVAAREAGYQVIALEVLVDLLDTHTHHIRNDIFADFARAQRRQLADRREALAAIEGSGGHLYLKRPFIQHAFLARLRDAALVDGDLSRLNRGANMDGSPWTHWAFAQSSTPLPGGPVETFFHRIDARQAPSGKRRYYLSTRQYATVRKKDPAVREEKVRRLNTYRRLFDEVAAAVDLEFARPATDRRGQNESEVGILFFDDERNSTANVLQRFRDVHRGFVERLRSSKP
ncbi:MAG: PD-(D/E)XK nuclease family protein [Dehalococcoidia bacterium]|nr:PD-(D/E)XK nuclease family protein [Dehalococcoidia bacterium]